MVKKAVYQPRRINTVQLLFKKHFQRFADQYEDKYAILYGRFRIERITEVAEKFILCGDYSQGIARFSAPILTVNTSISGHSPARGSTSARPARKNEPYCFRST